jgi:hypothetical protein
MPKYVGVKKLERINETSTTSLSIWWYLCKRYYRMLSSTVKIMYASLDENTYSVIDFFFKITRRPAALTNDPPSDPYFSSFTVLLPCAIRRCVGHYQYYHVTAAAVVALCGVLFLCFVLITFQMHRRKYSCVWFLSAYLALCDFPFCPLRNGIQNIPDWCRHVYSSCGSAENRSQQAKLWIPGSTANFYGDCVKRAKRRPEFWR